MTRTLENRLNGVKTVSNAFDVRRKSATLSLLVGAFDSCGSEGVRCEPFLRRCQTDRGMRERRVGLACLGDEQTMGSGSGPIATGLQSLEHAEDLRQMRI